ncbi:MAG: type II secretion system F family protein [Patescibacteria group bacterium]|jgi:type IV pilus assembly protein PilC
MIKETKKDWEKNTPKISQKKNFFEKINFYLLMHSSVPLREKLFFVQHLGVMLHSGISILTAFRTLAEQTESKTFSKILKLAASKLEGGTSLTETLKCYPNIFEELFVNMVASGELSGKLEEVFKQLYIQMKKQYELTAKVRGALTYPVIVICIMAGMAVFMMIYVMPKIMDMFKDYGADLPLATKIMIGLSGFLTEHGLPVLIVSVALILFLIKILRTIKGKYIFQGLILRLPIISGIVKKINLARFARTTSSLLKTDIMIIETFRITASVLGNLHYRKVVSEIGLSIKRGGQISEVIKKYPKFFPPVVTQMIIIGEQTGEIDSILEELAKFYEEEVEQIMENLPSIIEPLLILILGAGVGGMALAVIMPMYSITSAI